MEQNKGLMVAEIIMIVFKVINERLLVLIAMSMAFYLFVLAYMSNQYIPLGGAIAFSMIVFVPLLIKSYGGNRTNAE